MRPEESTHLRDCLERLGRGDQTATGELIAAVCERLRSLAHVMLRDYPRLRSRQETADVLQNALIRLHRALQTVAPATPRDFYRLATLQIRRELRDLVRHHFGPQGSGAHERDAAGGPDRS